MIRKYYEGWDGGSGGGDDPLNSANNNPIHTQEKDNTKGFLNNWLNKQFDQAFNAGINAAIEVAKNMLAEWPWEDDQDGYFLLDKDNLINQLTQLKKQTK